MAKRQAAEEAAAQLDGDDSESEAAESSTEELKAMSAEDKDVAIKQLTKQLRDLKAMVAQDYAAEWCYFAGTSLDGVLDGVGEARIAACDEQHRQLQQRLASEDEQPLRQYTADEFECFEVDKADMSKEVADQYQRDLVRFTGVTEADGSVLKLHTRVTARRVTDRPAKRRLAVSDSPAHNTGSAKRLRA